MNTINPRDVCSAIAKGLVVLGDANKLSLSSTDI